MALAVLIAVLVSICMVAATALACGLWTRKRAAELKQQPNTAAASQDAACVTIQGTAATPTGLSPALPSSRPACGSAAVDSGVAVLCPVVEHVPDPAHVPQSTQSLGHTQAQVGSIHSLSAPTTPPASYQELRLASADHTFLLDSTTRLHNAQAHSSDSTALLHNAQAHSSGQNSASLADMRPAGSHALLNASSRPLPNVQLGVQPTAGDKSFSLEQLITHMRKSHTVLTSPPFNTGATSGASGSGWGLAPSWSGQLPGGSAPQGLPSQSSAPAPIIWTHNPLGHIPPPQKHAGQSLSPHSQQGASLWTHSQPGSTPLPQLGSQPAAGSSWYEHSGPITSSRPTTRDSAIMRVSNIDSQDSVGFSFKPQGQQQGLSSGFPSISPPPGQSASISLDWGRDTSTGALQPFTLTGSQSPSQSGLQDSQPGLSSANQDSQPAAGPSLLQLPVTAESQQGQQVPLTVCMPVMRSQQPRLQHSNSLSSLMSSMDHVDPLFSQAGFELPKSRLSQPGAHHAYEPGQERTQRELAVAARLVASVLPDVQLLSVLGSGAHGTVYRGRCQGRIVAVKVVSHEAVVDEPGVGFMLTTTSRPAVGATSGEHAGLLDTVTSNPYLPLSVLQAASQRLPQLQVDNYEGSAALEQGFSAPGPVDPAAVAQPASFSGTSARAVGKEGSAPGRPLTAEQRKFMEGLVGLTAQHPNIVKAWRVVVQHMGRPDASTLVLTRTHAAEHMPWSLLSAHQTSQQQGSACQMPATSQQQGPARQAALACQSGTQQLQSQHSPHGSVGAPVPTKVTHACVTVTRESEVVGYRDAGEAGLEEQSTGATLHRSSDTSSDSFTSAYDNPHLASPMREPPEQPPSVCITRSSVLQPPPPPPGISLPYGAQPVQLFSDDSPRPAHTRSFLSTQHAPSLVHSTILEDAAEGVTSHAGSTATMSTHTTLQQQQTADPMRLYHTTGDIHHATLRPQLWHVHVQLPWDDTSQSDDELDLAPGDVRPLHSTGSSSEVPHAPAGRRLLADGGAGRSHQQAQAAGGLPSRHSAPLPATAHDGCSATSSVTALTAAVASEAHASNHGDGVQQGVGMQLLYPETMGQHMLDAFPSASTTAATNAVLRPQGPDPEAVHHDVLAQVEELLDAHRQWQQQQQQRVRLSARTNTTVNSAPGLCVMAGSARPTAGSKSRHSSRIEDACEGGVLGSPSSYTSASSRAVARTLVLDAPASPSLSASINTDGSHAALDAAPRGRNELLLPRQLSRLRHVSHSRRMSHTHEESVASTAVKALSLTASFSEPSSGGVAHADASARWAATWGTGGRHQYRTFIVQEYCSEGNLQDALQRGTFHQVADISTQVIDLASLISILLQVARGMLYLHSLALLHGDLKSANVMLQRAGAGYSTSHATVGNATSSQPSAQGAMTSEPHTEPSTLDEQPQQPQQQPHEQFMAQSTVPDAQQQAVHHGPQDRPSAPGHSGTPAHSSKNTQLAPIVAAVSSAQAAAAAATMHSTTSAQGAAVQTFDTGSAQSVHGRSPHSSMGQGTARTSQGSRSVSTARRSSRLRDLPDAAAAAAAAAAAHSQPHYGPPQDVHAPSSCTSQQGWVAKLADFGLARLLHGTGVVAAGHLPPDAMMVSRIGTVSHAPPETLRDAVVLLASDVYSFGVLMWEAYCGGEKPFEQLTPYQLMQAVVMDGARPPFPSHCPAAYSRLALDCMSHSPIARPSFEQVVSDLEQLQCSLPASVRVPLVEARRERQRLLAAQMTLADTATSGAGLFASWPTHITGPGEVPSQSHAATHQPPQAMGLYGRPGSSRSSWGPGSSANQHTPGPISSGAAGTHGSRHSPTSSPSTRAAQLAQLGPLHVLNASESPRGRSVGGSHLVLGSGSMQTAVLPDTQSAVADPVASYWELLGGQHHSSSASNSNSSAAPFAKLQAIIHSASGANHEARQPSKP